MWKLVDVQIIYKKLYQRELVTSDWFFVIRNNSGVQIFRNDEKARQRHLPKMYTLVVTMNWNRFRKIFRTRFCIFYNRSELSHCMSIFCVCYQWFHGFVKPKFKTGPGYWFLWESCELRFPKYLFLRYCLARAEEFNKNV